MGGGWKANFDRLGRGVVYYLGGAEGEEVRKNIHSMQVGLVGGCFFEYQIIFVLFFCLFVGGGGRGRGGEVRDLGEVWGTRNTEV